MSDFDFFRKRNNNRKDNVFFAGAAVDDGSVTSSFVEDSLYGEVAKNFRIENGIIKGYIYKSSNQDFLISGQSFVSIGDFDYIIIDNKGAFFIDPTNISNFAGCTMDYLWIPKISNVLNGVLGCSWKKRAYFPFVEDLGSRNFWGIYMNASIYEPTRIYTPSCNSVDDDSFYRFNTTSRRADNIYLYLDATIWNNIIPLELYERFINNGGTVILIQNYNAPSACGDAVITNITSTTFDITFPPATFQNTFGWYEVFCEENGNPVSRYFHHQEILNNTATITGLNPYTNYTVKVRASDIYMNLGLFNTPQQIQTLP